MYTDDITRSLALNESTAKPSREKRANEQSRRHAMSYYVARSAGGPLLISDPVYTVRRSVRSEDQQRVNAVSATVTDSGRPGSIPTYGALIV